MNQSDILSFAINGVREEIEKGIAEVKSLQCTLAELLEMDKADSEGRCFDCVRGEPEPAVGRPAGFVPVHEWELKDD